MKIRTFVTAFAILAGVAGPSLAFDHSAPVSSPLVHKVSCDPNGEGKQAMCMQKCDDAYIKASQAYQEGVKDPIGKAKEDKKACDAACGC